MSVKPIGESYTGQTIFKLAMEGYGSEDYLTRDFDHPVEITNYDMDENRKCYLKRLMKKLRVLSEKGDLKLGLDYARLCAITCAPINDRGSNVVKKVGYYKD